MSYWSSWHDFLAMGGYAGFVWGSYAVTALALAAEVFWVSGRRRAALARAAIARELREREAS
jgi:heme exporter protein D